MKIAIVSGDDVAGEDSGQFCAALAARGQDVTCFVRRRDRRRPPKGADEPSFQTVPIGVGPKAPQSDGDVLPFIGDWAAKLERQWSANPPDVVHAHGWLGGLAAQLAARRRHLPIVQTFRGLATTAHSGPTKDAVDVSERERIEPLLARNATWVTGESSVGVEALARFRHGRARLSVLLGGVDVERFSPVGPVAAHTDLPRILCLAPDPLPGNGFDIVIRALSRVPGAELVVAETAATNDSHDEARAQLQRLAKQVGVDDRVQFAGTVADKDLPGLLRSAGVLACTPREAPRATAVLEAMASGVAVVTLPVGVLTDAVVHAVTGYVLSPTKPAELVEALRRLQAQRFLRQSMGAAGRSRALSRFTWDRMALESLTIYQRVSALETAPPRRSGALTA
jgi:glycosyltransferase involved in cell wall biosynthesis